MRPRDALAAGLGLLIGITAVLLRHFHWDLGSFEADDLALFASWVLSPGTLLWAIFDRSIAFGILGAAINGAAYAGLSAVLPRPALRGRRRVVVSSLVAFYWLVGFGSIPLLMLLMSGSSD